MHCHGKRSFKPGFRVSGLRLSYRKNAESRLQEGFKSRLMGKMEAALADVLKGVIDSTLFRLALMFIEIGLKLLFGFGSVGYEVPLGPEG